MARSVTARRQGDEFQALFLWKQLVKLLVDDDLRGVVFESDQRIFVDDIVVEYSEPILDEYTGQLFQIDAYQCKYHVARNIVFSTDKLVDPKFLGNRKSMLQRLYEAYRLCTEKRESCRLHIVSSSGWAASDPFCRFLSSENHIRQGFFEKGSRSTQGQIRQKLANHLGITESELRDFLSLVRFDLGLNRRDLVENLAANLRLAGLLPIEKLITNTRYAELAWKWLEQGAHAFEKESFTQLVHRENLVDTSKKSLLIIRHQSLEPIVPNAVADDLPDDLRRLASHEVAVDMAHLFSDGRLTDLRVAIDLQREKTNEITRLYRNNPNIEIAYYGIAHIPLAFWLGYQLNIRKRIHIFEHNRKDNRWDLLDSQDSFPHLTVRHLTSETQGSGDDVVIRFGISYPILESDVNKIVPAPKFTGELTLPLPALDSIGNVNQLEVYASAFREMLDAIHNLDMKVSCIHVFYAGPVSLAFRCGQLISPTIHPPILVYNYSSKDAPKYKWGIRVNAPVDSRDFLVQM